MDPYMLLYLDMHLDMEQEVLMDPHLLLGLTLQPGTLLLNNTLLCPPGYPVIQWDTELLALDLGMNPKLDLNFKEEILVLGQDHHLCQLNMEPYSEAKPALLPMLSLGQIQMLVEKVYSSRAKFAPGRPLVAKKKKWGTIWISSTK